MTDEPPAGDGADEDTAPVEHTAADGGADGTAGAASAGTAATAAAGTDAGHATAGVTDSASVLRRTAVGTAQVAAREYRLSVRRRWVVGVAVLFALFSTALVFLGGSDVGPTRTNAVLASFAQVGVYLVPLAALAVGFDTVVGADESGSLEMLLALPLTATSVVVGKFFGRAVALAGGMLAGFAVGGVLLARYAGVGVLGSYASVVLAAVAAGCAFLGLGVLASTLATEKTHALGAALAAWVWFVLVHDLAALGLVATLDLPSWTVGAAVLLNPADLFRVLVLRTLPTTAGGIAGVLEATSLGGPVLLAALVVWLVLPVAGAVLAFRRRAV